MLDPDPEPDVTNAEELEEWLEQAVGRLERISRRDPRIVVAEAWIEAGFTTETLVGDGGLVAFRSRSRVWGFSRVGGYGCRGIPLAAASRRLRSLPVDAWSTQAGGLLEDIPPKWERSSELVFQGEAAARLVAFLSAALHGAGATPGVPVGRGWDVTDDPSDPEGLTGGWYDDAGFRTEALRLSDGVRTVGVLGSEGHFRRASFRDPPEPMFSTIAVHGPKIDVPARAASVWDLQIHRLAAERWILDAPGPGFLETSPFDLVRRCVGTIGPIHRSPLGVATPGLVFEGY